MRAIPSQHRRRGLAAGLVMTSVIALSILGGGTALAANPNWQVGHGTNNDPTQPQPTSGASSTFVSAGQQVGFFEWLKNADTSNISQLYLTADPANATYVGARFTIKDANQNFVRGGTCPTTPPLNCSIGALRSGQTVYVEVAFTASASLAEGSSLDVTLEFNTTGVVIGSNNSHGDAKRIPDSVGVTNNNPDAAGDYNFDNSDGFTVADDQSVSTKNPQATSVTVGALSVGAAVGERAGTETPCNATLTSGFPAFFSCGLLTSQTSIVEVGNGKNFNNPNGAGTPGIKAIVSFKKAPSQLGESNAFVYHYWVDASGVAHAELIQASCTLSGGFPTNHAPCITVGNNKVTVWLIHNGNMRS